MRSNRAARLFVLLVVTSAAPGCLGAYAFPTVACTPPVKVRAKCDEFHAFRVDITDQSALCPCQEQADRYRFTPVRKFGGDHLGPQACVSVDYGWFLLSVLSHGAHTHRTVAVRVYRAGYETVELKPWQMRSEIDWKPAETMAAREKAVDDLVSTEATDTRCRITSETENGQTGGTGPRVFAALAEGRASKGHREAMLLAAAEYERLAQSVDDSARSAEQQRLQRKALALYERAAR